MVEQIRFMEGAGLRGYDSGSRTLHFRCPDNANIAWSSLSVGYQSLKSRNLGIRVAAMISELIKPSLSNITPEPLTGSMGIHHLVSRVATRATILQRSGKLERTSRGLNWEVQMLTGVMSMKFPKIVGFLLLQKSLASETLLAKPRDHHQLFRPLCLGCKETRCFLSLAATKAYQERAPNKFLTTHPSGSQGMQLLIVGLFVRARTWSQNLLPGSCKHD